MRVWRSTAFPCRLFVAELDGNLRQLLCIGVGPTWQMYRVLAASIEAHRVSRGSIKDWDCFEGGRSVHSPEDAARQNESSEARPTPRPRSRTKPGNPDDRRSQSPRDPDPLRLLPKITPNSIC